MGAAVWNEWRQANAVEVPLLRGADLAGVSLRDVNLSPCPTLSVFLAFSL
jgi:hypothetical protein